MKSISLQVPEELLRQSRKYASNLHVSGSEYIRQALVKMNKLSQEELLRRRMFEASKRVRKESMRVNAEFESIDPVPDA